MVQYSGSVLRWLPRIFVPIAAAALSTSSLTATLAATLGGALIAVCLVPLPQMCGQSNVQLS